MYKIKDLLTVITYLSVATAYASVFQYIGISYSICFPALAAFAVYQEVKRTARIPRWALNAISVLVLGLSSLRINLEFIVEPVLEALIILTAIKLLEEKKFRDYMQIYTMCIFLLIGSAFISLSVTFLIYFLLLVILLTTSLILLAYFSEAPDMGIGVQNLSRVALTSLILCSIAIPASAFFFIILPRTNYPILSFFNKQGYSRSGFTESVSLGDVSGIQEDNHVIFRAEMERVNERALYWRGIVLDTFDGKTWKSSGTDELIAQDAPVEGKRVDQMIYLEPYGNKYLFALDHPVSITVVRGGHGGFPGYHPREYIYERVKYSATSVLSMSLAQEGIDRQRYLQLPKDFSPKIQVLVEDLAKGKTIEEILPTFLKFLKNGAYRYSLEDLPVSETPLEDFLLSHKYGNCEFFASSLAVMLRMAGIPARLVGGYKGGYYNAAGNYYMVLHSNAHIWVEAYTSNHQWIRLDPTPLLTDLRAQTEESDLLMQLRLLFDTFNYYWFKLVINYDLKKQLQLLESMRSVFMRTNFRVDVGKVEILGYILGTLATGIAVAILFFRFFSRRKSEEERLVEGFTRKMGRYGYERKPHEGLEEFLARIDREDLRVSATIFIAEFQRKFYRDEKFTREEIKRLRTYLHSL